MIRCPICKSEISGSGSANGSVLFPYSCTQCGNKLHYRVQRKVLFLLLVLSAFVFPTTIFIFSYIFNLPNGEPYLVGLFVLCLGAVLLYFKYGRTKQKLIKSNIYQIYLIRLLFFALVVFEIYRYVMST